MSSVLKWIAIIIMSVLVLVSRSNSKECNFFDTTNITAGQYHSANQSRTYDNVNYPFGQYDFYNYVIKRGKRVPVDRHIRGCLCELKICVRFNCSNSDRSLVNYTPEGAQCELYNANFTIPVKMKNRAVQNMTLNALKKQRNVSIIYESPNCDKLFEGYNFMINLETGHAKVANEISQQKYSIGIHKGKRTFLYCQDKEKDENEDWFLVYVTLASMPFLILTILLYQFVPALNDFIGKCIKRYLIILFVAFVAIFAIKTGKSHGFLLCKLYAYTMYYSYLSAFLWLNVICYHSCSHVMPCIYLFIDEKRRLRLYSIYAWCVPFIATLTIFALQFTDETKEWMPIMADSMCFLTNNRGRTYFFYCPLALICGANMVFFILTVYGIEKETFIVGSFKKLKLAKIKNELKESLIMSMELFLVMGISWSMEAVIHFAKDMNAHIVFVCDLFNSGQGIIIFVFTLWRPSVRDFILKRLQYWFGDSTNQETIEETDGTIITSVDHANILRREDQPEIGFFRKKSLHPL